MNGRFVWTAFACVAAVLGACEPRPRTELLVVADTNLDVPAELDTIRFVVRDDAGESKEAETVLSAGARPAIFAIVRGDGSEEVLVDAIGELDGVEVLRRTARTRFVAERTLTFRLDLLRECVDVDCPVDQTCGDDGCRPIELEEDEVRDWTGPPGGPDGGEHDGGSRDASMDARIVDTGTSDASPVDAPRPDAPPGECSIDDDCDDGVACTNDRCGAGGVCENEADDASCDDSIACTTDACDVSTGCAHSPVDSLCDDGVACTSDACDAVLGCRANPGHATCAAGSYCDTTTDCTVAPTFTTVYSTVIQSSCGPCHTTSGSPGGGLRMSTAAGAYVSLVGVSATCGTGNVRVIPRDSLRSLLWRKLSGVDLCGELMPRSARPLDADDIALIAHWIEGGALDD